ncbi:MAG: hypothetical protein OES12_04595 [Anaerolineae bacterium]|jgi:hypothetical protein|nr:hypothetical protein [Anaerolineae bacterium]
MKTKIDRSSWVAFGLFYIILVLIVSLLDTVNGVLELPYWGIQVGLITIGVGVFVLVGIRAPELTTGRGVLLAFTIGILTIIPAVLMGLGKIPGLWPQYFYIAFGMAAGSFLTYLFLKLTQRLIGKEQPEFKRERFK